MCLRNHYHNRMTFSRLNGWRLLRSTGKENLNQNTDARTRIIDVLIFHCYSESLGLFNLASSKICLSQSGPKCPAQQMKSEAEQEHGLNKERGQGGTMALLCFIRSVLRGDGEYRLLLSSGDLVCFLSRTHICNALYFHHSKNTEKSTWEDSR